MDNEKKGEDMKTIVCFILCLLLCGCAWADEIDDLIPHIIACESGGDPHAVSDKGAIGLCQITPIVLEEYNQYLPTPKMLMQDSFLRFDVTTNVNIQWRKQDLYQPKINKYIATWYLHRLKDYYLKEGNIQVFDAPFHSNIIRINTWDKVPTYSFKHTKYIKCADDYKLALILSAWNGGITKLRRYNYDVSKMPKETKNFVRNVLKLYEQNRR